MSNRPQGKSSKAAASKARPKAAPIKQESARGGRDPIAISAVIFGVLFVVAAITAIVFQSKYSNAKGAAADADGKEAARRAACLYANNLVSFDYHDLDSFFAKLQDGATGEWKSKVDSQVVPQLRDTAPKSQLVSRAGDIQCGLVTGDENSATVVVLVEQTTVRGDPPGEPSPSQFTMTTVMENHDGHWLIAKLDAPQFGR
ncbi:hypothetical protein [Antrihabitans stalactiti]|jgi:Mce-associated membrane protein|uniref:Mce-associated membrane protein n=1 Tax=Antrihabitans stalactiti TaxID=2584121 RepID=A0A848KHJ9_9NOCA|nr:hypothetical protein [Antrihabitans stalactiti]NMN95387.1 hypothetical protein [Antrihabitans stalactiti]